MAKDQITIHLECPDCHVPPHVDDETDDNSMVYCSKCDKKFGTYGEVKAKAIEAAKAKAVQTIRDVFKNRKGFKLNR